MPSADLVKSRESTMTAAEKVLAIVEQLALADRAATLAALAEATGIGKSSVHRILSELVGLGFAFAHGGGAYSSGPRLFAVGSSVVSRGSRVDVVEDLLRDLVGRVGETGHFSTRVGDEAVYVLKIESERPYRMKSEVGMRFPLHSTASGKAILAWSEPMDLERYLRDAHLQARTKRTIVTPEKLRRELAKVRAKGYGIDDEENETSIRCVAVPVLDSRGYAIGAVSVSSLANVLSSDAAHALVPAIRVAAEGISEIFGGPTGNQHAGDLDGRSLR
jgi:IclR family transcriptional regulator, acetate operon repressor